MSETVCFMWETEILMLITALLKYSCDQHGRNTHVDHWNTSVIQWSPWKYSCWSLEYFSNSVINIEYSGDQHEHSGPLWTLSRSPILSVCTPRQDPLGAHSMATTNRPWRNAITANVRSLLIWSPVELVTKIIITCIAIVLIRIITLLN